MSQELSRKGMSAVQATRISIIASMVSDEVMNEPSDYSVREFDAAFMFVDVSGFTDLCEMYTKAGRGGPSKLTQVLNSYIGSMVQEILIKNGDVHKFSGDAFLVKWRSSSSLSMQDVVHTAIDCALAIQKNYGTQMTDVGVVLRVKAAIAAGRAYFSLLGDDTTAHYAAVGQPVWDCKMAEQFCVAGDVITSPSAWKYANESEYWTELLPDGVHTRVLGVGAMWSRKEGVDVTFLQADDDEECASTLSFKHDLEEYVVEQCSDTDVQLNYREFALRPSVLTTIHGSRWPDLRRFMLSPVLRAVENDEPIEHLSEVRRVVVVFMNIICRPTSEVELLKKTDIAYKSVCGLVTTHGGLLNKVNLFDKDLMLLVVFGLRGLKQDDEAQKALYCAMAIRDSLTQVDGFLCVSVGVTSGSTYCGVVGHTLRREYTVIGPIVNKAARLMTTYKHKVTCDTDTFFNSKIDSDYFILVESKPLKGIPRPGPIYEYLKVKMRIQRNYGRDPEQLVPTGEVKRFRETLMPLIEQQRDSSYRHSGHRQYAFVILGPKMVGKSSMLNQCLNVTPKSISTMKLNLFANDKVPFGVIRLMFTKSLGVSERFSRTSLEQKIRSSVRVPALSPLEVHAVNSIFDLKFPPPESISYVGEFLTEPKVKTLIHGLCTSFFGNSWVCAIDDGQFIDDNSWTVLLLMMETGFIFFLITIPSEEILSTAARSSINNDMFVKINLSGIDRGYHTALACQALNVQAIPGDLEIVLQNFSGGMPGWIRDYVLSLMENDWLKVQSMPREKALAAGAVFPFSERLDKSEIPSSGAASNQKGNTGSLLEPESSTGATENITMAVLVDAYNIEDMNIGGLLDARILKTYDSLIPFEKLVVKCGSVLGNVFSRRMLEQLLRSSSKLLALAVKKLFEVDVLACQGGDFIDSTSLVLIRRAPVPEQLVVETPQCFCLGTNPHTDEHNLPSYAYCGYIRFKNPLFRSTTYDLLTETQKGLLRETSSQKSAAERINYLCADASKLRDSDQSSANIFRGCENSNVQMETYSNARRLTEYMKKQEENDLLRDSTVLISRSNLKGVRSFSSLDMSRCECLLILQVAYPQFIHHTHGAGEWTKLVEAYIEFAYINLICSDIPQAMELLLQVEHFIMHNRENNAGLEGWQKDKVQGRIISLRGACTFELGYLAEARKLLLRAMELHACPFPSTTFSIRLHSTQEALKQRFMLSVPSLLVGTESGVVGDSYEEVADALNYLHRSFMETKELANAELAAKWSLNLALRTNTNFRVLCDSYANMINITRQNKNFARCRQLERRSLELLRLRWRLEATELRAVNRLYASLFCFYIESGKAHEAIALGISTFRLFIEPTELATRHTLLLGLGKLLLKALRVQDLVDVMLVLRAGDHCDVSSLIWYYCMAMTVHLETGYSVETFSVCEEFYLEKEDDFRAPKASEAASNFFTVMWLMCVRQGQWERATLWEQRLTTGLSEKGVQRSREEQLGSIFSMKLLEGHIIRLVEETNNKNVRGIIDLDVAITRTLSDIEASRRLQEDHPRLYFLKAYNHMVHGRRWLALRWLAWSRRAAGLAGDEVTLIWCNHTMEHWLGTLGPELKRHWVEHAESRNLLSHHNFTQDTLVPYTLPLPKSSTQNFNNSLEFQAMMV